MHIKWAFHLAEVIRSKMNILEGSFYGGVPHPSLDDIKFCSNIKRMSGKTVAKSVDTASFGDLCFGLGLIVDALGCTYGHGAFFILTKKQPFFGALSPPILTQEVKALLRQYCISEKRKLIRCTEGGGD